MRCHAVAEIALKVPKKSRHGSRKGRGRAVYLNDDAWERLETFCEAAGEQPDDLSISKYLNTSVLLDFGMPVAEVGSTGVTDTSSTK